jgi:5-methylthioadenosine/S-adenosylhomocysteine deaminase
MTLDTLIHNATVVTMNAACGIIANGMVGVRNGSIEMVGAAPPQTPLPAASVLVDAGGGVVMPGLINAHTHLPMTLFRGLADDLPLHRWLQDIMFPAEAAHIDPDSARWGARLACAEMLLSGTTCCCDGYFHADSVAEAVKESGMRAVIAQGVIDFPAPGVPDPTMNVETAARFVDNWQDRCDRITPSIFCHAPYTCSAETMTTAKTAAGERGVLFQIHVSETEEEVRNSLEKNGARPVQYLNDLGVLDEQSLVVHGVWIDAAEIRTLARRRTAMAHCPSSNMKLGAGVAPVVPLREAGVVTGLGTDGSASNNTLDMFREMNTAAKLHKVHRHDPTAATAETVVAMATIEGARAIGLAEIIGPIEVGKRADLIVIDTAHPHLAPMYNPVSHAVYAMTGADVRHVMVDGHLVVRDKTLLSMDLEEIMDKVRWYGKRIGRDIAHHQKE